jgi:mono/diheme cytochrome c family protein
VNAVNPAIVLSTALAVALATTPQPVLAQSSRGDAASGRLYAMNWCTECHSVEPETAGTGRFAPDFTAVAKSPSTTGFSLRAFLRSDHLRMPRFALKRTEVDDIVAYILSLRRR